MRRLDLDPRSGHVRTPSIGGDAVVDATNTVACCRGSLEARVRHLTGTPVVVELAGALDLAAVDALAAVLDDLEDCPLISLDLGQVTFLDCAGLGAIMAHHHRLLARSGRLLLVHVPPVARRILEQTGLEDTLTTLDLAPRPQTSSTSGSPHG